MKASHILHLKLLRCFFVYLLFHIPLNNNAIDIYRYITAKAAALGECYSIADGLSNPALYAFETQRKIHLNYCNRYGIKELATFSATFNYPNRYLDAAFIACRYGFDAYNETLLGINVYKALNTKIALGIRINYLLINYADWKNPLGVFTSDVGLLTHPVDKLYLSLLAINPLRTSLAIHQETMSLPSIFLVGMKYNFSKALYGVAELEKDIRYDILLKLGLAYQAFEQISFYIGGYTQPFTPTFGVGWNYKHWNANIGFKRHPVLGIQYLCGLNFDF